MIGLTKGGDGEITPDCGPALGISAGREEKESNYLESGSQDEHTDWAIEEDFRFFIVLILVISNLYQE